VRCVVAVLLLMYCCTEAHVRLCQVEIVPMSYVNDAMKRVKKGDVKFRFVIDVQSSLFE
jgi:D-arabinose 1-dehydrogenase-like Zn-dependent alcohol dehydrogenase